MVKKIHADFIRKSLENSFFMKIQCKNKEKTVQKNLSKILQNYNGTTAKLAENNKNSNSAVKTLERCKKFTRTVKIQRK